MQRDHIFNRSTRPLLDSSDYHYSVQVKKKTQTDHKLHGFNDFNFVANQYKNLNNSNSGYPYGSPPSTPRHQSNHSTNIDDYMDSLGENSNDFIFSDDSGIHINNTSNFSNQSMLPITSPLSPNYYDDDDVINKRNMQTNAKRNKNGFFNVWNGSNNSANNNENCVQKMGGKKVAAIAPTPINQLNCNEPFIFGVHSNTSCYTFAKIHNDSVINSTINDKYSTIDGNRLKLNEVLQQNADGVAVSAVDAKSQCKGKNKDQRLTKKGPKRTKREKRTKCKKKQKDGHEIKCVVVGDGMVGKTNLILSYLEHRFTTEHIPTASDIYNFEVKVDDNPVQVTLCDTAGQDFLDPLRRLCYPDSDVFLLCFSVVKPETFASIQKKWAPNFRKSHASIVLIGTQSDLRTDPKAVAELSTRNEKPVSKSDAWDYAASIGAKYIETSSRANKNVKEAFDTAIWDALRSLNESLSPPLWKKLLCLS